MPSSLAASVAAVLTGGQRVLALIALVLSSAYCLMAIVAIVGAFS